MTPEEKEAKLKEIMELAYEIYPNARRLVIRIDDSITVSTEEKFAL